MHNRIRALKVVTETKQHQQVSPPCTVYHSNNNGKPTPYFVFVCIYLIIGVQFEPGATSESLLSPPTTSMNKIKK